MIAQQLADELAAERLLQQRQEAEAEADRVFAGVPMAASSSSSTPAFRVPPANIVEASPEVLASIAAASAERERAAASAAAGAGVDLSSSGSSDEEPFRNLR